MEFRKLASIVLAIVSLLAFLSIMPIIINSATTSSADTLATGDQATASMIKLLPLLASISGVGVSLLIVMKIRKS
tara:strand:- start:606 stop:830 length:225 start_codon:yes stop_codon:yes gene_type:complete